MDINNLMASLTSQDPMSILQSGVMASPEAQSMLAMHQGMPGGGMGVPNVSAPQGGVANPMAHAPMPQVPMGGPPGAGAQPVAPEGPSLFQRIVQRLFHTPTALQGAISPEDQANARSQALIQMGAALTGAGLPPGSHSKFGMNLSRALMTGPQAYQGGLQGALQSSQEGMQMNLARGQAQARQQLSELTPPAATSTPQERLNWALRALQTGAAAGLSNELMPFAREAWAAENDIARQATMKGQTPTADWEPHNINDKWYMVNKRTGEARDMGAMGAKPINPNAPAKADPVLAQQEREFMTTIKPTLGTALAAQRAQTALEAARTNPAAYGSALVNYVKTAENGAQLRQGMFQYFAQHLDPSIKGRLDIWENKLASGVYPTQVIDNMLSHVGAMSDTDRQFFRRTRADYVKRYPGLDQRLVTEDGLFGPQKQTGNAADVDKILAHP